MSLTFSPGVVLSALLLSLACQTATSCDTSGAPARTANIDAERAWKHLEAQVALGPRPSGSAELEACRKYLEAELTALGLKPVRQTFKSMTPVGELEFANLIADIPGSDPKEGWIILGSHYDTKRMPFPFVGANDGASSTAVLIEIAREIKKQKPSPFTYRIVFFDGEEATRAEWAGDDNTYGSRHFAAELKRSGDKDKARAFVLLDMVGDKDLKLTRDSYSERKLVDCFFGAARKNGLGAHVDGKPLEIRDDHLSLMAIGVMSVDLIDFEYGPNNAYWHTKDDVVANCSKESLGIAGRITLLGLQDLETMLR